MKNRFAVRVIGYITYVYLPNIYVARCTVRAPMEITVLEVKNLQNFALRY